MPAALIQRLKKRLNNRTEKRSIISRRFIIVISVIYSVLIIAVSVSFHMLLNMNADILRDTLITQNREFLSGKIETFIAGLQLKKTGDLGVIKNEILGYNAVNGGLIAVNIFMKTEDENYFRLVDTLPFAGDIGVDLQPSAVVREQKNINYLKTGLLHGMVDPDIYAQNGHYWQNVYHPFTINNKKAVLQFMVSVSKTQEAVDTYAAAVDTMRAYIIALTVVLVIAVIVLTIIFLYNYSLLLKNLSRYMEKAAEGDLDISLNATEDIELSQLARSFNTLIDELKDKSAKPAEPGQPSEPAELSALFNTGVTLLKENRINEAIAVFKTLTVFKPNGFGSYFNLGVAYAKNREHALSIQMFEEARKLNPTLDITTAYIEKVKRLQNNDA